MAKTTPSGFDDLQKLITQTYAEGQFAHLTPADVDGCGDGLLHFLLTELSKKEDCQSIEQAIDRVDTAIRELTDLRAALQGKL